jgi:hypothetical protein
VCAVIPVESSQNKWPIPKLFFKHTKWGGGESQSLVAYRENNKMANWMFSIK